MGGYKPHGPKPQDWSQGLPKKVRKFGLRVALSSKLRDRRLTIVDNFVADVSAVGVLCCAAAAGKNTAWVGPPTLYSRCVSFRFVFGPVIGQTAKTKFFTELMAAHDVAGTTSVFIDCT